MYDFLLFSVLCVFLSTLYNDVMEAKNLQIRGVTFAAFAPAGSLSSKESQESLELLINRTGANLVVLVPNGLQETAQSEEICYTSPATVTDQELRDTIKEIHSKGLMVALKPTVNCKNGTWRAHISFFDKDVKCEPKWSNWFKSYTDFQLHFAKIAQEENVEIFIPGCEMVMSEHRDAEWRKLISDIRTVYSGIVTYNTDKYQEDNISWWDCLDMISSSGYYPSGEWKENLDRIEKVVKSFNKPFFFAETGCMSRTGSSSVPNDWRIQGDVNLEEQDKWYKEMFKETKKRSWINGWCLWDWSWKLYPEEKSKDDKGYALFAKPAEKTVKKNYLEK